jgi:hypothetical protein
VIAMTNQPVSIDTRTASSGRGWAFTGIVAGGVVSVAANIAHTFIPPEQAAETWMPESGAVVGAIVWPVFLFIAVEILVRVRWRLGLIWLVVRWGGLLPVAGVAALVSYRHLSGLLAYYGEEPIVAYLGPIAVDGLMVMATAALLSTSHHGSTGTPASGNAAVKFNPIEHGTAVAPEPLSIPAVRHNAVPSTIPAPILEPSTLDTAPPEETDPTPAASPAVAASVPTPALPENPAALAARITKSRTNPPASTTEPARAARPDRSRTNTPATPAPKLAPSTTDMHVSASDAAQLALPIVPPELLAQAREVARKHRAEHGTPINQGQLAAQLRMNSEVARNLLAILDQAPEHVTSAVSTGNGKSVQATR